MASVTFEHDIHSTQSTSPDRSRLARPTFSQTRTSDRLRECERRPSTSTSLSKPRRSVFREEGLDDLEHSVHPSHLVQNDRKRSVSVAQDGDEDSHSHDKNHTFDGILKDMEYKESNEESKKTRNSPWFSKLGKRPRITSVASAPPGTFSTIPRTALIVCLIAVVVPGFRYSSGKDKVNISGADAGVIMRPEFVGNGNMIGGRQESSADVCTRWAGQSMFLPYLQDLATDIL